MQRQIQQLIEFHKAFGLEIQYDPKGWDGSEERWEKVIDLRKKLILEESQEVATEMDYDMDPYSFAKELADLIYVTIGAVISFGLQDKFEAVFDEVHRSNMSKLVDGKPLLREDGKVLKGPNYTKADIGSILK